MEEESGDYVLYSDVEKLIVKLTQGEHWNSPSLTPLTGNECSIRLIDGREFPALWTDAGWVKPMGYVPDFDFEFKDVIIWRYNEGPKRW